jgi:hypothetical protein
LEHRFARQSVQNGRAAPARPRRDATYHADIPQEYGAPVARLANKPQALLRWGCWVTLEKGMRVSGHATHAWRVITVAASLAFMVSLVPSSAEAEIDTGAAVGLGLGSFALGTALGAASNPYYRPYGYYYPGAPVYYPPPPGYYPPPAYYPPVRSCWDPYYARYYPC